jgi:hypothetical protein
VNGLFIYETSVFAKPGKSLTRPVR